MVEIICDRLSAITLMQTGKVDGLRQIKWICGACSVVILNLPPAHV